MKHTPGPWKPVIANYSEDNLSWLACADVVTTKGATLVRFEGTQDYQENEEYEANARLIAAAPEMLACLEMVEHSHDAETQEKFFKELHRVLAKARGEK